MREEVRNGANKWLFVWTNALLIWWSMVAVPRFV